MATQVNKSSLFKRMHELVKTTVHTLSSALKQAWAEAKTPKAVINVVRFQTTWHKANDSVAMTYKQWDYILDLIHRLAEKLGITFQNPFNSATNAFRSLTKFQASEIIDTLKSGIMVDFVDQF